MKNSIRRLISFTMVLALLILSAAVLNSCYVIKSGKMNKIEGTYQLTGYSGKGDNIAERGIIMYMVIRADGTGYYAYRDNNQTPYVSELRCRFIQDTEQAGLYSYVEIDFGTGTYEKFGINAPTWGKSTNLNSQKPVWKPIEWGEPLEIDYNISVDFLRVDNATDLSYITEEFGKAPSLPYGAKKYDGTYKLEGVFLNDKSPDVATVPDNPYVYYYVTFDFVDRTAQIYNMSKSNEITSTVRISDIALLYENGNYRIDVGGKSYVINTLNSTLSCSLDIEENIDDGCYTLRFHHWGDMSKEQILDNIESDVSNYLATKDFSKD